MISRALWTASVAISCLARSVVAAPPLAVASAQASAFMGTWVIAMTNPQGATQTVKIWDGDTMNLAQMLEYSETIKRGSGKKQVEPSPGKKPE